MHPTKRDARIAGLFYVLMGFGAPFALIYLPGKLIVPENAAATASRVLDHEMLFRLGIVAELNCAVFFVLLAVALYHLLAGVNRNQARLMVSFVLVSVAITFANMVSNIGALLLLHGGDSLAAFDIAQREALALLFLRLHGQGVLVNHIFWGLWLIPFGLLVIRSGFLPRILGVLLVVNGMAYVVISGVGLLLPAYTMVLFRASMPALLGELWITLWLLIKGVKEKSALPASA